MPPSVPPGTVAVIAKEPVPGQVKTRLCPPFTGTAAATLAAAALRDSVDAAMGTAADRRVLVLDGRPPSWLPEGLEVIPQRGGGLAERLAAAFDDLGGPTLLIGMDTPQVTPALLDGGLRTLQAPDVEAVLGFAADGGYWAIGLAEPDETVFHGVPMSTARTGEAQLERLWATGHRVTLLPELCDVDTVIDAEVIANAAPRSRFAAAYRRLVPVLAESGAEQ